MRSTPLSPTQADEEKTRQQFSRADEALNLLPTAGAMVPTRVVRTATEMDAKTQKTDNAVAELRSYASSLEGRLPFSKDTVRRREDATETSLRKSGVADIEVGGERRYVEEAAEIHRLDAAALKAADHQDLTRAKALLDEAEAKFSALAEIILRERKLAASGAPQEAMDALKASFNDYGTINQKRAQRIDQAVDIFLENSEMLANEQLKPARDNIFKLISMLGKGAEACSAYSAKAEATASEFLGSLSEGFSRIKAEREKREAEERESKHDTILADTGHWAKDAADMRSQPRVSAEYKESLARMKTDAEAMHARILKGEEIPEQEYARLEARMKQAQRGEDMLKRLDPSVREGASRILARGFDAQAAITKEESKESVGATQLQYFLFSECTRSGAASSARKQDEEWSARLAKGEDQNRIIREIGASMGAELSARNTASGIPEEGTREEIAKIAGKLGEKDASLETLQRGRMALAIAGEFNGRDVRSLGSEAREHEQGIYSRALSGLLVGMPLEYADRQMALARMFLKPEAGRKNDAMRADIESVSQSAERAARLDALHTAMSSPGVNKSTIDDTALKLIGSEAGAKALAEDYRKLGADEDERGKAIKALEGNVNIYLRMDETYTSMRGAEREAASRYGPRSEAANHFSVEADRIGSIMAGSAKGRMPTEAEVQEVEARRVMYFGRPDEIEKVVAKSQEDIPRVRAMLAGTQNFSELIFSSKGDARGKIMGEAATAADAAAAGKAEMILPLLLGSAAIAKTTDARDRFEIFSSSQQMSQGQISTEENAWFARTEVDRINAESKATDAGQRRQLRYMFESAEMLSRRKDTDGAELLRTAANNYASAIHLDQSDPRAKAAIDFAYRLAGDARGDKALAAHRVRDMSFQEGDPQRWDPARGTLPGLSGASIASKKALTESLAAESPAESDKGTVFGDVLALDPEKRMQGLRFAEGIIGARIGKQEHEARNKTLEGQDKTKTAMIDRTYKAQQAFHEAKSQKAMASGDRIEAERQKEEAERADSKAIRERLDESDSIYGQGLAALEEAYKLRIAALGEKDAKKSEDAIARANKAGDRGMMIVELAESDQTALGSLHGSFMTTRTNRRELGRRQADEAAETFARTGRKAAIRAPGAGVMAVASLAMYSFTPGRADQIALEQASRDMGAAQANFAEQRFVSHQSAAWNKRLAELEERNEANDRNFGSKREGGPIKTSVGFGHNGQTAEAHDDRIAHDPTKPELWRTSKTYRAVEAGTDIINAERRRTDIHRARAAVSMEEFNAAGYWYGIASRGIAIDGLRAQTEIRYRELMAGAQPSEQKDGVFRTQEWRSQGGNRKEVGFDYVGLMGGLFAADYNLTSGRTADCDALTSGYPERLTYAYQSQRTLNNKHREHEQIERAQAMEKGAHEWGIPSPEQLNAERKQDDQIRSKGGKPDETAKRAHRQTIDMVRSIGAPKALEDQANAKAKEAASREAESNTILDHLVDRGAARSFDRDDVQGLFNAYFMATGRSSPYEKRGKDEALERIQRDPDFLAIALGYQKTHPPPGGGGGWGGPKPDPGPQERDDRDAMALSWARSAKSTEDFNYFARGYEMGISTLGEAVSRFETVDRYEREHGYGGNGAWYIGMRDHAGKLLQAGLAISGDAEGSIRSIENGERVILPRINMPLRTGDPNYMDARIEVSEDRATLPSAIRSSTSGFFSALQQMSVGTPVSMNENIERMEKGKAPILGWDQPERTADMYTMTVMARGRLWRDKGSEQYMSVNMSREEEDALFGFLNKTPDNDRPRDSVGGVESAMQRFADVGLNLTMVWSDSERKEMYETLGAYSAGIAGGIDRIMGGRANGVPLGERTLAETAKEIEFERRAAEIGYREAYESGRSSESAARGFYAVGKLAGAGLMIASGFGSVMGVGFGVEALHSLSEDSRKAGGFDQLSTKQQVLGVGGVAIGFTGAFLGELSAFSDTAIVSGETGTFVEAFATGGTGTRIIGFGMTGGGLGMAGTGIYDSYQGWHSGEMGTFEFVAGGMAGFMQAVAPVAMHAMPTRFATRLWTSNTTGARMFRGGMLFLTGETQGAMATADANQRTIAFHREFNHLSEPQQTAFRMVEASTGMPLTGEDGMRVMSLMPREMTPETRARFVSDATGLVTELPRVQALEAGFAAHAEGKLTPQRAAELNLSPQDVALFRRGGPFGGLNENNAGRTITDFVLSENRSRAFDAASADAVSHASPPAVQRAQELAGRYRAFVRGQPETGTSASETQLFTQLSQGAPEDAARALVTQAETETAGQLAAMRQARARAAQATERSALINQFGVMHAGGAGFSYTKDGLVYSEEHGNAAADLALAAQTVLARPASEQADAMRGLFPPQSRAEEARMQNRRNAVADLVNDPGFAAAARSGDRSAMIDSALNRAASIPDISLSQEYISSRISSGADNLLADHTVPVDSLRRLADHEEARAQLMRKNAADSAADATRYPPGSHEQQEHLATADRQTKTAIAHENDVARLLAEADLRAPPEEEAVTNVIPPPPPPEQEPVTAVRPPPPPPVTQKPPETILPPPQPGGGTSRGAGQHAYQRRMSRAEREAAMNPEGRSREGQLPRGPMGDIRRRAMGIGEPTGPLGKGEEGAPATESKKPPAERVTVPPKGKKAAAKREAPEKEAHAPVEERTPIIPKEEIIVQQAAKGRSAEAPQVEEKTPVGRVEPVKAAPRMRLPEIPEAKEARSASELGDIARNERPESIREKAARAHEAAEEEANNSRLLNAVATVQMGKERDTTLAASEARAMNARLLRLESNALTEMGRESEPEGRSRIAADYGQAVTEIGRVEAVKRARAALSPELATAEDHAAMSAFAQARTIDPSAIEKAYGDGGTEGQLRALDAAGMKNPLAKLAKDRQDAHEKADSLAQSPEAQRWRARAEELDDVYKSAAAGLFDLFFRGGFDSRLGGIPGFEDASIDGVTYFGGIRGVFRLEMSNGRHVFLKMEDVGPAEIGAQLAKAHGLVASATYANDGYSFSRTYADPATGREVTDTTRFGFMEDIHDFKGRETDMRMPEGNMARVKVEEVGLFKNIINNPDRNNPLHKRFFDMLQTPRGRQEIFKAWRAYQELSRESLLMDRYGRNTAVFLVEGEGGPRIVFQPIDTDGVGYKISPNDQGRPEFVWFNEDFADATVGFINDIAKAASAQSIGPEPLSNRLGMDELCQDMFSIEAEDGARIRIPDDERPGVDARVGQIFRENDGKPIGVGFDATKGNVQVGALSMMGGKHRIVSRSDGRVNLNADEFSSAAQTAKEEQGPFARQQMTMVSYKLAPQVMEIAEKIANGEPVSTDIPEYEIALRVAHEPGFAGEDTQVKMNIAPDVIRQIAGERPTARPPRRRTTAAPSEAVSAPPIEATPEALRSPRMPRIDEEAAIARARDSLAPRPTSRRPGAGRISEEPQRVGGLVPPPILEGEPQERATVAPKARGGPVLEAQTGQTEAPKPAPEIIQGQEPAVTARPPRKGKGRKAEKAPAERPAEDVLGVKPEDFIAGGARFGRVVPGKDGEPARVEFTYDVDFGPANSRRRTITVTELKPGDGEFVFPDEKADHFARGVEEGIRGIKAEREAVLKGEETQAGGLDRRLASVAGLVRDGDMSHEQLVSEYPEYYEAVRAINKAGEASRGEEAARQARMLDLERESPESTPQARRLLAMAEDIAAQARGAGGLGFRGPPNERAVARMLSDDPAYKEAVRKGDMPQAIKIAREFEEVLDQVNAVKPVFRQGQQVDEVENARKVIAIGDVHGDVYGLMDLLLRSGVLEGPPLPPRDQFIASLNAEREAASGSNSFAYAMGRYRLNPELPEGTEIVFDGDMVGRGTTSMGVLDLVRGLQQSAPESGVRVHTVRGNHEAVELRFIDLFKDRSQQDVLRALDDPSATFDFSRPMAGFEGFLSSFGIDLRNATLGDVGIGARAAGLRATYESIIEKYGSWENAMKQMEADGTMDFLRGTRGAVIIDGNLFTHGGPAMKAGNRAELDQHYATLFGAVHTNHWGWNETGSVGNFRPGYFLKMAAEGFTIPEHPLPAGVPVTEGDMTNDYVTQSGWHQNLDTPQGQAWMRGLGIEHMYVGHDATQEVTLVSDKVTNLDASLSDQYGGRGGVLIIDPLEPVAHVKVVTGRTEAEVYSPSESRNVVIAGQETAETDFTHGRDRSAAMPGNRIAGLAQGIIDVRDTLGMRPGELPDGVRYDGRTEGGGIRLSLEAPGGRTTFSVEPAPDLVPGSPEAVRHAQRDMYSGYRQAVERRIRMLETSENLVDRHGDTPPAPELAPMLAAERSPQVRGTARVLDQLASSSRPMEAIESQYPEYAGAVEEIRGHSGEDRAYSIMRRARVINGERAKTRQELDMTERLLRDSDAPPTQITQTVADVSRHATRYANMEPGSVPRDDVDLFFLRLVNRETANNTDPNETRDTAAMRVLEGVSRDGAAISAMRGRVPRPKGSDTRSPVPARERTAGQSLPGRISFSGPYSCATWRSSLPKSCRPSST